MESPNKSEHSSDDEVASLDKTEESEPSMLLEDEEKEAFEEI